MLQFAITPSKQVVQTLKKTLEQLKHVADSRLPFPPGLVVHDYEETINKGMWILWKQVSTKYNTQKVPEQPQGSLLSSYRSFAWLHLGKGVREKETGWLPSLSVGGLHWCAGLDQLLAPPFFLLICREWWKIWSAQRMSTGLQSPACRICFCSQPDLQQSHCRPALPSRRVPEIPIRHSPAGAENKVTDAYTWGILCVLIMRFSCANCVEIHHCA